MFCGLPALPKEDNNSVLFRKRAVDYTQHSHSCVFLTICLPHSSPSSLPLLTFTFFHSSSTLNTLSRTLLSLPLPVSLTCEADIKDVIPVEPAPVQCLHAVAQLGGVEAQAPLHIVEGGGHGIHRVHHEHDLGLWFKVALVHGQVLITRRGRRLSQPDASPSSAQGALEPLLPEFPVPGVTEVFSRVQTEEVAVELWHGIGRQLERDGSLRGDLVPLDDALLCAPAVAGHPDEGGVEPGRGRQQLPGVVAAQEEHGHTSVGLLEELPDHSFVRLLSVGASHLDRKRTSIWWFDSSPSAPCIDFHHHHSEGEKKKGLPAAVSHHHVPP